MDLFTMLNEIIDPKLKYSVLSAFKSQQHINTVEAGSRLGKKSTNRSGIMLI